MSRSTPARPAAAVRGDIQKGRTGDKVAGFDPAAAPLETDAEAAGTPMPVEDSSLPSGSPAANPNAASHGTAMRRFASERSLPRSWLPFSIFVLVLAALIAAAAMLLR
jgi:hypothetical protein